MLLENQAASTTGHHLVPDPFTASARQVNDMSGKESFELRAVTERALVHVDDLHGSS